MTEDLVKLKKFLSKLPPDLAPIARIAEEYADRYNMIGISKRSFDIAHRFDVPPNKFAIGLHRPLAKERVDKCLTHKNVAALAVYRNILDHMNGFTIFGFCLFGIPKRNLLHSLALSVNSDPFDVASANADWKYQFTTKSELFMIGADSISHDQVEGFFLTDAQLIVSIDKNSGELSNQWTSMCDFFEHTIENSRRNYLNLEDHYLGERNK